MKLTRLRNQAGFSLVEVLIALFIFTIGAMAAAKMQYQSVSRNSDVNSMVQATMLAQSKLEELLALNLADINLEAGDLDGADGAAGLNDQTVAKADGSANPLDYAGRYWIFWNFDPSAADRKTVRVIVTWQEKGIDKSYSLDYVLL